MNKFFQVILFSLLLLVAVGCNDSLTSVGGSVSPEGDQAVVETDTFNIGVSTVPMGPVYAHTHLPLLGSYTDPVFGEIEADFMSEFFCPDDFKLHYTPTYDQLDSVEIWVYYSSYTGERLSPQQVSIYSLNKPLEKNYYSDVDPSNYYTLSNLLGVKSYTVWDATIPDSIANSSSRAIPIRVKMSAEFTKKIYSYLKNNPEYFSSSEAFKKNILQGIYVKNSFGKGTLLDIGYYQSNVVKSVSLRMFYRFTQSRKDENKSDTILNTFAAIPVSELSVQCNRFKSGNFDTSDPKLAYIQAPAGQMMELSLPIGKILNKLPKDAYINSMKYQFKIGSPTFGGTKLKPTRYLLLIPKDKVKDFFENKEVIDADKSNFYAVYDSTTYSYNFGNIAALLNNEIEERKDRVTPLDEELKMVVLPISIGFEVVNSSSTMVSVSHYFGPGGIRVKKDELKDGSWGHTTSIVYSRFNPQSKHVNVD